ncbi:MAG: NAD(P)/FAD-dependent oxidoreductase, partial [Thiohalomonadales bacterium]
TYAKRNCNPSYRDYIGRSFDNSENPDINGLLGGFYQSKTGYVDIPSLLRLLKDYFIQNGCYLSKKFSYQSVSLTSNKLTVDTYSSHRIIFCEGYRLRSNPWFAGLPIIPTKGEILSLRSSNFRSSNIISNGHWLLPLKQDLYRFGASFEPHREDTLASNNVRLQLLEKLSRMVTSNPAFDVIGHSAGIRPCTQDRMPLIGMHPRFQQIGVFNGFGSKGLLTIPYFADLFSRSIRNIDHVHHEASISRFSYQRENNVFGKTCT